ncbi:MAG: glucose-6-phosphate isomerase, partial [Rikenellaceae bacterium]
MKIKVEKAVSQEQLLALEPQMIKFNDLLHTGEGEGSDFLGWVNLPSSITSEQLSEIESTAKELASSCEVVISVGIGGSYLGAKAVVDACGNSFDWLQRDRTSPIVIFAGQNISEDYMSELLDSLQGRSIGAVVISKSGTTTEPAIAFRILKAEIEKRYGKEGASQRIVAVTDKERGALRTLATTE